MATGVNVKLGVEYNAFKKGMQESAESVKTLNQALKLNEAQLKLNGNEELFLKNQTELLKEQIKAQTEVVKQAEAALKAMKDNGVSATSKQFQEMQGKVYAAATKLTDMKTNLAEYESGAKGAATQTGSLNKNVEKLSRAEAWQNFADGVSKVTQKLEAGARAAVNFGRKVFNSFKSSTEWADDLKTLSDTTGYSVETLQQMQKVADLVDTDVDAIIAAKKRMSKAVAGDGKDTIAELFGINITGNENPDDLFWNIGEALLAMGESFDKENAAQKVFGRNWNELLPLFKTGREEYEKMLSEQSYLTKEQVYKLAEADDTMKQMEQEIQQLKNQFWSDNADKITSMMQWLVDNKGAVITALEGIGGAFAAIKIMDFATGLGQTINGLKELKLLPGGPSGDTTTVPTGQNTDTGTASGGKNWFGAFLDNLVQGMPVKSALDQYEMLTAKLKQDLAGLTIEEQQKKAFEQAFGSQAEFEAWANKRNLENQGSGAYFGESDTKYVDPISDTVIHKDRRTGEIIDLMENSYDKMVATQEETTKNNTESNRWMTEAFVDAAKGMPGEVAAAIAEAIGGLTLSSNLYFENYGGSGAYDASALEAAIANIQRRKSSGFGS